MKSTKRMKKLAWSLVAVLPLLFVRDAAADPLADIFGLLTGFAAKEGCSCAFVVEQSDAYCTAFAQQPGYTVTVAIDHASQTFTATFAGGSRSASVLTPGGGCTLAAQ